MKCIFQSRHREVWAAALEHSSQFISPFAGHDFASLVMVADETLTTDFGLCDAVVNQGCRYVVCAGHECDKWEYWFDTSDICSDPNISPSSDRLLMTTALRDKSIHEVAFFFVTCAHFDGFQGERLLCLVLGNADCLDEVVDAVLHELHESESFLDPRE